MKQVNLETSGQPREVIKKHLELAKRLDLVVKIKINGVPLTINQTDSIDDKLTEYVYKRRKQLNGGWFTKYKPVLLSFIFLILIFIITIIGVILWT